MIMWNHDNFNNTITQFISYSVHVKFECVTVAPKGGGYTAFGKHNFKKLINPNKNVESMLQKNFQ